MSSATTSRATSGAGSPFRARSRLRPSGSLVALPVINSWSRWVETRADDFALKLTGTPGPFIGAMERLADLNLSERDPHFLKELFLHSHPSVGRRIARARTGVWS